MFKNAMVSKISEKLGMIYFDHSLSGTKSLQEWTKFCGRQPLKNFKGFDLLIAEHKPSNFLKTVFHKIYLVHS